MQTKVKKGKKGGKMPGAGRPKGKKNAKTILREATLAEVKVQIAKMADTLIRAQSVVAIGYHKVVVITKDESGIPQVEQVNDPERIEQLIATGILGEDYHIVVGSKPDGKVADMLLNRAFGKPEESIDLSNKDGTLSLKALSEAVKAKKKIWKQKS